MMAFLEKLERKAEQWIGAMDGQINQPIVSAMTGDVFTHSTSDVQDALPSLQVQVTAVTNEDDSQKGHPYTAPSHTPALKDVRLARQSS